MEAGNRIIEENIIQTDKKNIEMEDLELTKEWDKIFPKSYKVNHSKVTFRNRYGITLAADMYTPKNINGKMAAIAVSGPFGAVKEQASGLYAQTMAERGFLTFAFPVAGSIGVLITTVVALLRYVRRGYLYIFGGALIAAGGLAMLLEFLLNLTFGVHQTFFWSFYPLAAGVLLGVMLIIIAVCPPLRRSLHRKFFL